MKLNIAFFAATLALSACAESTVRMPDGSTHTCRHYFDGVVLWDGSDDEAANAACIRIGAERMIDGVK